MNRQFTTFLRKTVFLLGAVSLGAAAQAQTPNPSDSTHRRHFGPGNHQGFAPGFRRHGEFIHYTPEQRKQVAEINKDFRTKSAELYKKDNITLREYKASLLALQKDKKAKLEALLTPQQKEAIAARRKRMSENMQVMAAARMERLKLHLNLSDDQVSKLKASQQDLRSQMKAIHENESLLPQQKMEQMKALMAKRDDSFKSILTPDQYSQFEKMKTMRHRGPRGGRGFDRGEGGRSGGLQNPV